MLIVETTVGPSSVHGTGCFAAEDIKAGQIVWVLIKGFDPTFTRNDYEKLPEAAKSYCKWFMYWSDKLSLYVMCLDNARHFNHSVNPNTESLWFGREEVRNRAHLTEEQWDNVEFAEGFTVALRDIKKGEELLSNYLTDFIDTGGAGTHDFLAH